MSALLKTTRKLSCLAMAILPISLWAQSWQADLGEHKGFIKNEGQFEVHGPEYREQPVVYAYDGVGEDYLFTAAGVILEFSDIKKARKSEAEKKARAERKKQGFNTLKEWQDFERAGTRLDITYDQLQVQWIGANPNALIVPGKKQLNHHSYSYENNAGKEVNVNNIPAYEMLTYKNLYPNIDVVYEFHPDGGFKYSVIVHPGGDVSQVQLRYSKTGVLENNGAITTATNFGPVVDHAPFTFYEGNQQRIITSRYLLSGNTISFEVGQYDNSETIVIDPWTQTPSFNTNWDCIWECERDAAGNVYVIGGVMPLQLLKYNAGGVLQWTYNTPYDTTAWLGVFATDDAGNSYVTNGSTAQIQMVNTGGGVVWNNPSPGGLFSSTEFWNIAFNCDQTRLVIGGTGGILPPEPYIYDIDMATGNVLSSVKVTESTIAGLPPNTQEVRSITATENEKYYFLTHDSIGYVEQGLTLCPGQNAPFHVENGGYDLGYKCENWRYNNTGVEAIAYYGGFIFVNRGDRLDKRDFNTANIIASAAIPGGVFTNVFLGGNQLENSGIEIDDCGNIFVGASNGVVQFDQNLNVTATFPTTFNVYDVAVTSTGEVAAAGSTGDANSNSRTGTVQTFAAGACAPQATVCCNPSVCPVEPLCTSDAPVTFTTYTPGGTWSTGPGFDPNTGTFDPGAAGAGTYTFYYTITCGTDSVTVVVSDCNPMSICVETNGDLTVSGGTGPFNWLEPTTTQDCSACLVGCIIPAGCAVNVLSWSSFATGTTVTPYAGADSVAVVDAMGDTLFVYDITTLPPCGAICDATIDPAGPYCVNDAPVNLTAADPGGTWSGTGITDAVNGTFDPATAGAGTHTITYTLGCGSSDTETITVNPLDDATFSYAQASYCLTDPNPTPTVTGLGGGSFAIDNGGTINTTTGEIDLAGSGAGSYVVTYTTNGTCPNSSTFNITITAGADATIDPAGPFCENAAATNLTAADPGGTWSGTGITDAVNGTFDPATAGVGSHVITYTIAGACGDTDTETIVVNALDDAIFIFAQGSYCLSDPNPTPTISGLGGGSFSIDNGGIINTSTGEIDLAGSGVGTYTITYTTNGPCPNTATFNVTITTGADATIDPAGPFCENDPAINLTAADPGGTWSGTGITDAVNGTFDPATAGVGTHTITYTIAGGCGDTDTETITVNAVDDPSFTYAQALYCLSDPNPTPNITGVAGGTFTIDNGGTINAGTGEIDLTASGAGAYVVTYITNGPCPDTATFNLTITLTADATIDAAGPFCENDPAINLTAADPGGTWSGTGITDAVNGTFDPATAGVGTHTITYTITGSCGATDTETITVNAVDDPSFTYAQALYCLSDPNPTPNITGVAGGTFTIDNGGIINAGTGEIDLTASGAGAYVITYITNGPCPDTATFNLTITLTADATIDAAGPFCENDPAINLTAANTGGTWSGTGITDAVNGTFDPATAGVGTHTITYTITGSCGATDTETITVNAVDDPSFTYAQALYCLSDPNPTPNITGVAGGTFTIDNGGTINAGTGEIDLTASGAGAYVITYITNGPCPDTAAFNLTITLTADATIDAAGPFCENDPAINLTAANTGGTWSGTGITDAVNGTFDPATAGVGTHTITYTITGSCGATDTETIIVNAADDASFTYTSTNYCIADPDPVATITGTPGGTFSMTGGSINAADGTIDLAGTGAGTYTVYYSTTGACPDIDSITVVINDQLDATITPAGPFCVNDSLFTFTANDPGGTWSGPGMTGGVFNPAAAGVGTWDIIYTIGGACGDSDTIQVTVNPLPTAYAGADTTIFIGGTATLLGTGGGTYFWTPPTGLSCTTCQSPLASPLDTTTYILLVTSIDGCSSTDTVTVFVIEDESEIFVPNIFSPNGDGNNDVFKVEGAGLNNFNLRIYNRWGELVFESSDQSQGWDGTQRGKEMNTAVFVYVITYADADLLPQTLSGNVTLIR